MMKLEIYSGEEIKPYIREISRFRIEHFVEFPYLYQGDFDYERSYIIGYAQDPRALLVLLKDGEKVVGIFTGMPLISDSDIVADAAKIFRDNGVDPAEYYYLGEAILDANYRGKGWYRKMDALIADQARSLGFHKLCFLAVDRALDHPQRPTDYSDIDAIVTRLGYHKTNMSVTYHWPTIQPDGSVRKQDNQLSFWTN